MEGIADGDGAVDENMKQAADTQGNGDVEADTIEQAVVVPVVESDGGADVQATGDVEADGADGAEVVINCKEEDLSFAESTHEIPLDSSEIELKVKTCESKDPETNESKEDLSPIKNDIEKEDPQDGIAEISLENTPITDKPDSSKDEYVELDSIIHDSDDKTKKPEVKEEKRVVVKEERSIWLSNINPNTTASQLKLELSRCGKVLAAKIITNGEKYYGYALMEKSEDVKLCTEKLNGKKFNGYEVEVGVEAPNKKKVEPKIKPEKKHEEKSRSRKPRKRSRSQDPLTLKVAPHRRTRSKQRTRSSSRRRQIKREEELRLRRQRELEIKIESEKRKLDAEKRQFQREKLEFIRMQRRAEEEKREREERERKKLQEIKRRRRSNTPVVARKAWRRSKSASPHRKIIKLDKSPKLRRRKLSLTPPGVRSKSHLHRSKRSSTPKHDKIYRREENRIPPPPPRLTHEDLRAKADPWKVNIERKPKIEYYRSKDDCVLERDNRERVYHQDNNYNDRKRFRENSFERKYTDLVKYPKEDDKYKESKPRNYENTSKDLPLKPVGVRSEVYQVQPRNTMPYCPNEATRRFDNVAYPTQYNRGYVPNTTNYQNTNVQQQVSPWSRPVYSKDYLVPPIQNKPFHQDRYDDYDKRYQYFGSNRKY